MQEKSDCDAMMYPLFSLNLRLNFARTRSGQEFLSLSVFACQDAAPLPQLPQLPAMISPPKSTEAETFGEPSTGVFAFSHTLRLLTGGAGLPPRQTPLTKEQEIKGALATEEGVAVFFLATEIET